MVKAQLTELGLNSGARVQSKSFPEFPVVSGDADADRECFILS